MCLPYNPLTRLVVSIYSFDPALRDILLGPRRGNMRTYEMVYYIVLHDTRAAKTKLDTYA